MCRVFGDPLRDAPRFRLIQRDLDIRPHPVDDDRFPPNSHKHVLWGPPFDATADQVDNIRPCHLAHEVRPRLDVPPRVLLVRCRPPSLSEQAREHPPEVGQTEDQDARLSLCHRP